MSTLSSSHPARLLTGALVIAERLGAKFHCSAVMTVLRDALGFSRDLAGVSCEIAKEAGLLEAEIRRRGADGVFDADDVKSLTALASEIREEASTGKIITTARMVA